MRDRVLIDSSVWIAYLQSKPPGPLAEAVDAVLSKHEVHVPKIVIAELMQGAHSEKDLAAIGEFHEAFTIIGEKEHTWVEAGKLSYELKKKGKTINLADCYIAVLAMENNCSIMTLDKHFREIQKGTGITLHPV